MNEQTDISVPRRLVRTSTRVLVALVVLAIACLFGVRLAGMQLNVVQTASMSPSLPANTVTLVRPVDPQAVAVGDVITFIDASDRPVMHRVVEIIDHAGIRRFRTKGDANRQADRELVHEKRLTGGLFVAAPHVGAALQLTQTRWGVVYLVGLQIPLLAWAWSGSNARRSPRSPSIPPLEALWMVPCVTTSTHLCPAWLYRADHR